MKQYKSKVAAEWAANESVQNYYKLAETSLWMQTFCDDRSQFKRALDPHLDDKVVLELACGHGRHSERVAPRAKQFIGVDVS